METKLIRIASIDNVAVAVQSLIKGDIVNIDEDAFTLLSDIPEGHKVALRNIAKDEPIIKSGYPIGRAKEEIKKGQIAHIFNIESFSYESLEYSYNEDWAKECIKTFELDKTRWTGLIPAIQAYKRQDGRIGIRNSIWILPVDEKASVEAKNLASWGCANLNTPDGIYAYPALCDTEESLSLLANLMKHPNAGGVLILASKYKNETINKLQAIVSDENLTRVKFSAVSNEADIASCKAILEELALELRKDKRSVQPMNKLSIGIKCDGAESFAAITGNYLVGNFCNELLAMGGTAILVECPEIFGAEEILINRAINEDVYKDILKSLKSFKEDIIKSGQAVYTKPSPSEKAGGISTIEEKALGCIQKSGKSPVEAVLNYGDFASKNGLSLLFGTEGDVESTIAETAAGAHIILFTTGIESQLESPVPTIKIASNPNLSSKMIDFNASKMLDKSPEEVTNEFISLITSIANGEMHTRNEI